ncbi:putative phage abortive infection protein [uncultured Chitinophaga sp.]|uniref:putative phage abortive infection protein n=1 Tax=uncultured Chitinophaga sp. TaxID=339340 RepID=UPI0025CF7BD6|nr:putative phage abortive infection protein [uncultured Chitinophaga sp.]
MTILIFLVCGTLLALSLGYLAKFTRVYVKKYIKDQNGEVAKLGWFSIFLILIALILIIFSFLAPVTLTMNALTPELSFKGKGEIGDTIGGIMNPFIALAGVIVTGLAFYMQYKANELQRVLFAEGQKASNEQFQKQLNYQQFEAQFYEMLKLHKENVNEMELNGKQLIEDSWIPLSITKRKVFQEMQREFETLLELASINRNNRLQDLENPNFRSRYYSLSSETFNECYKIFFWGFHAANNYKLTEHAIEDIQNIQKYQYKGSDDFNAIRANDLNFSIESFKGHSWLLGHYFRHLYLLVTFVVDSKVVSTHDEKMRYLKVVRAQLSNFEQIMLFYNWISGFGDAWEDDTHKYFTKYKIIHNLPHTFLFENDFISRKVDFLRARYKENEKDELFEIDE